MQQQNTLAVIKTAVEKAFAFPTAILEPYCHLSV